MRKPSIPSVNTEQHCWSAGKRVRKEVTQNSVLNPLFHQSTQNHMVVSGKACEERNGTELCPEHFIPFVDTEPRGGKRESLMGKGAELRTQRRPSVPPISTLSHCT